jgi:hypothetical protein
MAVTVGSPQFFRGGRMALNLAAFYAGTVETIRLDEIAYATTGDLSLALPHATALRLVLDNGDGVFSSADTVIDAQVSFGSGGSLKFTLDDFFLFPGSVNYFLLEAEFANSLADGLYCRTDLVVTSCKAVGIEYSPSGFPEPREGGFPPALYGTRVQGATLYYGTPTSGGGDGGGDGGTPTPSSGGGGGGCFVATAAFGGASTEAVSDLCALRDEWSSASTVFGLRDLYYSVSPALAGNMRAAVRCVLRGLIKAVPSSE